MGECAGAGTWAAAHAIEETGAWYSAATLKFRGWTPALIGEYLDIPDRLRPHPQRRTAAPIAFYAVARVLEAERQGALSGRGQRVRRSETRAQQLRDKEQQSLLRLVETLPLSLPRLSHREVTAVSVAHYNGRQAYLYRRFMGLQRDPYVAKLNSYPPFLHRICVNYLRHECTPYDIHLFGTFGKVGMDEAKRRIRRRVFTLIAAEYPQFAEECARQLALRLGEVGE